MAGQLHWIPFLPLLGFLLNGVLGTRLGNRFVAIVGCTAPAAAFAIACRAFAELGEGRDALTETLYPWLSCAGFEASFGFLFDRLSSVMVLVVTGVGTLIHVYSVGYMRGDPGTYRYFSFLNLFMAMMLILVLADNLLLLFVGWEGVGLCSYLLIGFWFEDREKADAGMKAFIVNRIGDFGFLIGMILVFIHLGTLDLGRLSGDFDLLAARAGLSAGGVVITAITLLLFLGATGKSAQIPLYVWLPDAMAGPTPVSALIHAATMVTAGVYMVLRLHPLFAAAPITMGVVTGIGTLTAVWAALIALSQTDIKKVLAYSTVSQLGYMFLAAGLGAYTASLFHLVMHAFFKALLFLAAGSVIIALHHEQDMRRMGGLRARIPFTYIAFLVGAMAISGIVPLSGFVSKDEILYQAFRRVSEGFFPHGLVWIVATLVAGLTALYTFRLIILVFHGEPRSKGHERVREPSAFMAVPVGALAVLSAIGGFIGWPGFLLGGNRFHAFLHGFWGKAEPPSEHAMEWLSMGISSGVAVAGIIIAFHLLGRGRRLLERVTEGTAPGRWALEASRNKFYVDELYDRIIVGPFRSGTTLVWIFVDRIIIDLFLVGGAGAVARALGGGLRRIQTGWVPFYAGIFALGVIGILSYLVLRMT